MVSGSSVGNTVTTGSVTIPMMKKTGYPGEFAGAVEAAASTGGQIMPPIMGAAAFIMAEMTGYDYSDIMSVRSCGVPLLLGIFLGVHFRRRSSASSASSVRNCPSGRSCCRKSICSCP